MKNLVYILVFLSFVGFAQEKDKALMQANDLIFEANEKVDEDFINAEVEYRKAISKKPSYAKGKYNLGNAYYKSGLFDEALLRHLEAAENATTKKEKHKAYHNIGNALMKQNMCKEAVEAFKNALRNNPSDEETRYNFALAKECAEQQGQGEDDESEDENEDENKEDQKEEGDENEDNQDQDGEDEQKENEGDDKEDKDGKPQDEKDNNDSKDPKNQKKNQQQPGKLSPQQVKNLLEAMNNQEKKVQEKINAKKAKGPKVRAEKDW